MSRDRSAPGSRGLPDPADLDDDEAEYGDKAGLVVRMPFDLWIEVSGLPFLLRALADLRSKILRRLRPQELHFLRRASIFFHQVLLSLPSFPEHR